MRGGGPRPRTSEELVQVVAYLGAVTPELVIDLVPFELSQRGKCRARRGENNLGVGSEAIKGIDECRVERKAPSEAQLQLARMADWADGVAGEGLLNRLTTYRGKSGTSPLLPRLPDEDVG